MKERREWRRESGKPPKGWETVHDAILLYSILLIQEKTSKRLRKSLEDDIREAHNTKKIGNSLRYFPLLNPFILEEKNIMEEREGWRQRCR